MSTPSATRANELLADGEWHDGLQFLREIEKLITPGVARRRAERLREVTATSRHSEVRERVHERSDSFLIASGRRSITQAMVHNRIRQGSWEVEPWPVPESGWRIGGWRIRSQRVGRIPLTVLAQQEGISKDKAKELMLAEPALKHRATTRCLFVHDVEGFRERVKEWRAGSFERRSAASKAARERQAAQPATRLSVRALAEHSGMAPTTARQIADQSPDLGWVTVGRARFLPVEALPQWERAVTDYNSPEQVHARRSRAAKLGRARQLERRDAKEGSHTPTLTDQDLTGPLARYVAGETDLRERVHSGMRQAWQDAGEA